MEICSAARHAAEPILAVFVDVSYLSDLQIFTLKISKNPTTSAQIVILPLLCSQDLGLLPKLLAAPACLSTNRYLPTQLIITPSLASMELMSALRRSCMDLLSSLLQFQICQAFCISLDFKVSAHCMFCDSEIFLGFTDLWSFWSNISGHIFSMSSGDNRKIEYKL